ncbi:MAG: ABC transporter permease subunit [Antricoccus sp.]
MSQANIDPQGAAAGYRPGQTLGFTVEIRRQLGRRRTIGVFAFMAALPLILVLAFAIGSPQDAGRQGVVNLTDVATTSALNFVLFVFFVTTGFFLVVVFALFFGDTVASEASWGSLRYLLAIPVPRARLLVRKLAVAMTLSIAALLVLIVVALAAGTIFYGWHGVSTPVGIEIDPGTASVRLLGIAGYIVANMTMVGALAFLLSVRTDAPLAAVGGTVFIVIVSSILGQVTALGDLRNWLPTQYNFAWVGLLGVPPDTSDMIKGVSFAFGYAAVFLALAFWHFRRKDVTS